MKCCSYVRYLFLFLATAIGSGAGIFAALMAAENRRFAHDNPKQEFFHELYWLFAVGIALSVFFLFWVSMFAVIAYLIGFFSEPEEIKYDSIGDKTIRTETTEDEADSSDYMNALIKANTKVKSISQYGGLSQKNNTSQKQEPKPSEETKATRRTASTESTGSNYFKQLMKGHGKVKSVSQYKGPAK